MYLCVYIWMGEVGTDKNDVGERIRDKSLGIVWKQIQSICI